MPEEANRTEDRLDELYREHPGGFVAGRNELAKELRAAGDRDEAERVRKLRRPSVPAWLINRAALASPDALAEFERASRRLADAQRRALEGDDEAVAEWRAAAARQRDAGAAVVERAAGLARDAGHPVSQRTLELVAETLHAAAADVRVRDRVMRGRLEREQTATTLGTSLGAAPSRRGSGAARRRDVARARRELDRLRAELGEARDREERLSESVERMAETLREERSRLSDAKRETAKLRRRVEAAERRARD